MEFGFIDLNEVCQLNLKWFEVYLYVGYIYVSWGDYENVLNVYDCVVKVDCIVLEVYCYCVKVYS